MIEFGRIRLALMEVNIDQLGGEWDYVGMVGRPKTTSGCVSRDKKYSVEVWPPCIEGELDFPCLKARVTYQGIRGSTSMAERRAMQTIADKNNIEYTEDNCFTREAASINELRYVLKQIKKAEKQAEELVKKEVERLIE